MLKILQARLQQYVTMNFQMFKLVLEKAEEPEIKLPTSVWIIEKAREFQKNMDPGLGRSPGGGHGNPLQYSCLENPMDRGAWWANSPQGLRVRHDRNNLACTHQEFRSFCCAPELEGVGSQAEAVLSPLCELREAPPARGH